MKHLVLAALSLSMLVGCSKGSMSGTVGGNNLNVADAIFANVNDNSGASVFALLVMSDKPNLCDSLKANRVAKQATSISFAIVRYNSDDKVLAPDIGDYTVIEGNAPGAGNFASAGFGHTDANCTNTLSESASTGRSGLIKVTNFKPETNGNMAGTYDVTFGAGDHVTGGFNASYCDITTLQVNPNCE